MRIGRRRLLGAGCGAGLGWTDECVRASVGCFWKIVDREVRAGGVEIGFEQWNVNVFEDLTRSDAEGAIGGFDQVVSFAAGVLTAERVGEAEVGSELPGLYQKPGAIGDPGVSRFHSND